MHDGVDHPHLKKSYMYASVISGVHLLIHVFNYFWQLGYHVDMLEFLCRMRVEECRNVHGGCSRKE